MPTFGIRGNLKKALRVALASVFVWATPLRPAHAQSCVSATGETRAAILNVMRAPVASDLRTKVEFKVERARVCGAWSFVLATPQRPGGGQMRWSGTPCEGDTSQVVGALLKRKAGGWDLVDYALCPSDVAWTDWPEKYEAPAEVFEE